ncbi:Nicotinamide riboside kinase [Halocaridina rubra]|uniref:Nicotinamide riboside kinase n=1 Tax=Halocaridina rubra TaxID=373956 RepID=A0AAN8X6Y5_HALRR
MSHWLVVALSGVTNGGKSTLTKQLLEVLPKSTNLLCQDDYFYPEDSSHHVPCPGGLSHHNWDIITSMNMEKMKVDVKDVFTSRPKEDLSIDRNSPGASPTSECSSSYRPILLLDGFLLFDDSELTELCDLRFFFTLSREQCWERRCSRVYDPPDPPGYFEQCVWPMYETHLAHVKENVQNVHFLNGTEDHFEMVHQKILKAAKIVLK